MTKQLDCLEFSDRLADLLDEAADRESADDHLTDEERSELVAEAKAEYPEADWTGDDDADFLSIIF